MTRQAVLGAGLLLAGLLAAAPARAEVQEYARSNGWTAFRGVANDGIRVCGVSIRGGGRYFAIKHFAGTRHLTLHLGKVGWTIPRGTPVPVRLSIDRANPWRANARAIDDSLISISIGNDSDAELADVKEFLNIFRNGARMQVQFLQGNEGAWTTALAGSSEISTHLVSCMANFSGREAMATPRDGRPGQPAPPGPPTQPFGGGGGGGGGPDNNTGSAGKGGGGPSYDGPSRRDTSPPPGGPSAGAPSGKTGALEDRVDDATPGPSGPNGGSGRPQRRT
ncbi:hypothetical protein [Roseomonas sp. 18066]|uniref:hypothetical protein n=1 Tax=Roseomonas sp. 18066 TaxID=2681412 RepID=UPI00135B4752|nr:hypothetical protein [Roseomonas sp. 18066]